jgi:hypothetical protein
MAEFIFARVVNIKPFRVISNFMILPSISQIITAELVFRAMLEN